MPSKKGVHELKDICVKLITKELSDIQSHNRLNVYRQLRKPMLNETGQQFLLPDNLIDSIYSSLKKAKLINEFNLELFIRKCMRNLLLINTSPRIVDVIKSILPELETLVISKECKFTSNDMIELITNLPNLTSLTLSKTIADNNVMDTILVTCSKLKFLNISKTKVVNLPFTKYTCRNSTIPLICKNLLYLDINGLQLTIRTCIRMLKLFPYLQVLGSDNTISILKLYCSKTSNPPLNLRELYIDHMSDQDLKNIYKSCPYLQKLFLWSSEWNHESTKIISQFIDLKQLNLYLDSINIHIIKELLRLCGDSIKKLELFQCEVDLVEIARFCPNIKTLELSDSYLNYSSSKNYFYNNCTKLSQIHISYFRNRGEIQVVMESLLQFCCKTIKSLCITQTDLTNDDMKIIFQND